LIFVFVFAKIEKSSRRGGVVPCQAHNLEAPVQFGAAQQGNKKIIKRKEKARPELEEESGERISPVLENSQLKAGVRS